MDTPATVCLVCQKQPPRGDMGKARHVCDRCIGIASRVDLIVNATAVSDLSGMPLEDAMEAVSWATALGIPAEVVDHRLAPKYLAESRGFTAAMTRPWEER